MKHLVRKERMTMTLLNYLRVLIGILLSAYVGYAGNPRSGLIYTVERPFQTLLVLRGGSESGGKWIARKLAKEGVHDPTLRTKWGGLAQDKSQASVSNTSVRMGKMGKRHVRARDQDLFRRMQAVEGGHLNPVGRGKTGRPVDSDESLTSWKGWEIRTAIQARAAKGNAVKSNITVLCSSGNNGSLNFTIPLTKQQLQAMSKKELFRTARKHAVVITGDGLTNRQVRDLIQPFLAAEPVPSEKLIQFTSKQKSLYHSSVWIDGEEKSVYGSGGPTDTDFEAMAAEEVQKMEQEQVLEGGMKYTKRERVEVVKRKAQEYSDVYFRLVLTGKVNIDSENRTQQHEDRGEDSVASWKSLPEALDHKAVDMSLPFDERDEWATADRRDFSHYSQYELNEKLMDAVEVGSVCGINAVSYLNFCSPDCTLGVMTRTNQLTKHDLLHAVALTKKPFCTPSGKPRFLLTVQPSTQLAKAGAKVNCCTGKFARGWTALFSACAQGDACAVEALCDLGANVSAKTEVRNTPLHVLGATSGCGKSAQILVEFGADVNAVNDALWGPLHCAAYSGNVAFAEFLCEAGGNISALSGDGMNGLNKTGEALSAIGDAFLNGTFPRKEITLRKPRNPQNFEPVNHEGVEETSESAEEIRRNAEKVNIFSSSSDLAGDGFIE